MKKAELVNFILDLKFEEKNTNSYTKEYDYSDDKLTVEYKFKKEMVYVIYHTIKGKQKSLKGRLKNLGFKVDNTISGFRDIKAY